MDPEENIEVSPDKAQNADLPEQDAETPAEPSDNFKDRLSALIRPLYMKVILSTLALILLVWGALSMCSSPPAIIKPRYTIGLDPSWGPLQLGNREYNMTAFSETILYDIAAKMDLHIAIHHSNMDVLFHEFQRGTYQGIVSMMLPPSPRSGKSHPIVISDPIYRLGPVLVINARSPFKDLESMNGRVVGLVGDNRVDINISQFPNVIFSGYNSPTTAFTDLNNRKIDGLIVNSLIAKNFVHGLYAGKLEIAPAVLTREGIVLILHKTPTTENLIAQFNQELKKLRENGTYATLLKTWRVQEE
jgi:polar amino acid transport system substrate-binding protein